MACVDGSQTCVFGECVDGTCVCHGSWEGETCYHNPAGDTAAGMFFKITATMVAVGNLVWAFYALYREHRRVKASGMALTTNVKPFVGFCGAMICLSMLGGVINVNWFIRYEPNAVFARLGYSFARFACAGLCYLWTGVMAWHHEKLLKISFGTVAGVITMMDLVFLVVFWNQRPDNVPVALLLLSLFTGLLVMVLPTVLGLRLLRTLHKMDAHRKSLGMEPIPFTSKVRWITIRIIACCLTLVGVVVWYGAFDLLRTGGLLYFVNAWCNAIAFTSLGASIVQFTITEDPEGQGNPAQRPLRRFVDRVATHSSARLSRESRNSKTSADEAQMPVSTDDTAIAEAAAASQTV